MKRLNRMVLSSDKNNWRQYVKHVTRHFPSKDLAELTFRIWQSLECLCGVNAEY